MRNVGGRYQGQDLMMNPTLLAYVPAGPDGFGIDVRLKARGITPSILHRLEAPPILRIRITRLRE